MTIKKLTIVAITLLVLMGCGKSPAPFNPGDYKKAKMVSIGSEIGNVMKINDLMTLMISNEQNPNAWVTSSDKIFFTDGMFNHFDDDGLKFCMAHEMAHKKLGHINKKLLVSYSTTGALMIANLFIPGSGLLNYIANPAITNNFNKGQEIEADLLASKTCSLIGISIDKQIKVLTIMQGIHDSGGGFFDQHPSWGDRINAIREISDAR